MVALSRMVTRGVRTTFRPFSRAILPIATGITRRILAWKGVIIQERMVHKTMAGWYFGPSKARTRPDVPILLVHGLSANAITWGLQINALRTVGPVYAIDLPGFGLSGYPQGRRFATFQEQCTFLEHFIETVIGRPTLIAGYSLGGWLAVRLAWQRPDLVAGVALINPGGAWLKGPESWLPFVRQFRMETVSMVQPVYRQIFGNWLVHFLLTFAEYGFWELFQRDAVQPFFAAIQKDDLLQGEELRRSPVPIGLFWGLNDRFMPAGTLEFFLDNLPAGSLVVLMRRCGHLAIWDRPWSVIQFIQEMGKRVTTTSKSMRTVAQNRSQPWHPKHRDTSPWSITSTTSVLR